MMTEQERFNAELQLKATLQEAKFNMLVNELKEQREDMRRAQDKHDKDIKAIDDKFDRLSEQIHTMTIAAVVGFGAIVAAIGGLIVAALK